MDIKPITIPATQTIELQADKIYMDDLLVNAPKGTNPTAAIHITPYTTDPATKTDIYSTQQITLTTKNLYLAAAKIPEIAIALQTVQNAIVAWFTYTRQIQAQIKQIQEQIAKLQDTQTQNQLNLIQNQETLTQAQTTLAKYNQDIIDIDPNKLTQQITQAQQDYQTTTEQIAQNRTDIQEQITQLEHTKTLIDPANS